MNHLQCPHCKNDNPKMIEIIGKKNLDIKYRCEVCSKYCIVQKEEE